MPDPRGGEVVLSRAGIPDDRLRDREGAPLWSPGAGPGSTLPEESEYVSTGVQTAVRPGIAKQSVGCVVRSAVDRGYDVTVCMVATAALLTPL